jgi:hypothetical protein
MDMDGEMNRHMDRYLHRRVDGNVRIYMYVPIDTHICMYKYIYVCKHKSKYSCLLASIYIGGFMH